MANTNKKPLNKEKASKIFKNTRVIVHRLTPAEKMQLDPNKGSQFLGYASLELQVAIQGAILALRLEDVCLKLVGKNRTFQWDAPTGRYEDSKGNDKFPPKYFPANAETRKVIDAHLLKNEEVAARIAEAREALEEMENDGGEGSEFGESSQAAEQDDDPFADA